tara:strand:+ start:128 stop:730 length:603 start_codon:yes stop_codon:yes gene_type:complete
MKSIFIYSFFLITTLYSAQAEEQIKHLLSERKKLEVVQSRILDSINQIDLKIQKIKSSEIKQKIKDSSLVAYLRISTKIKDEPTALGKPLATLPANSEVIILDYSEGYYQICSDLICGYINEIWVIPSQDLRRYVDIKKGEPTHNPVRNFNYNNKQTTSKKQTQKRVTRPSKIYYTGPRGGCYYINSKGNKSYVSRSLCN